MNSNFAHAFDQTFLLRFTFALVFYWVWGILAKGIFEPIQAHLGKKLYAALHRSSQAVYRRSIDSCSALDDLFMGYVSNASGRVNSIINPDDLTPKESAKLRELVKAQYDIGKLLDKLKT